MKEIKIQAVPEKVIVEYMDRPLILPEAIRKIHEEYWQKRTEENPSLTNGTVYCIGEAEHSPEKLHIQVHKTDYSHYLYTINHLGADNPCRVIYTCAAILTNDNHLVFGKMNNHTSTPQRLQFAGGGIDETDLKDNRFNLEENIKREVQEELGLHPEQFSIRPKYLKSGGEHDHWAVIFECKIQLNADQVKTAFEHHANSLITVGKHSEFSELIILEGNPDTLSEFVKGNTQPKVDYLEPYLLSIST
ncbi:NUDIX hydrolase [Bacillus infantis]|uniref:NUDIX hydrolase n=1 Tax=Bacillus infantis TaxID=324767 RepID=A0A5D4SKI1_9BACI|nr:NUDIX hydrolase [Bacillus infantis]TYS63977.1 NUDIX hydrolase [Bacillus infantis]